MERRLGRPKGGQPRLTRDRIVSAALEVVDEHGIDALSMRRLAAALKVDPMAIYHYLPGKAAVLSALVEAVFAGLRVPLVTSTRWQDQVRAFAQTYRDVVRSHPNLAQYVVTNADVAAAATLEASEALYAALETTGLPPGMILRAADLVVDYVNGFALAESSGALEHSGDRQELLLQLRDRAPEDLPVTRRVLESVQGDEGGVDFKFGLDVILTGLETLVRSHAGKGM